MIKRFTYKELTLILGIIVAVIIIFTLWIRQPSNAILGVSKFPVLSGYHIVDQNVVKNINAFEELLSNRNNPY